MYDINIIFTQIVTIDLPCGSLIAGTVVDNPIG